MIYKGMVFLLIYKLKIKLIYKYEKSKLIFHLYLYKTHTPI